VPIQNLTKKLANAFRSRNISVFETNVIMDTTTAVLIGLGIIALVFIAFFAVFRKKGKGEIKGPFGLGLKVEGGNESASPAGVKIKDADAGGNVLAKDSTGQGVDLERIKAKGDIEATSASRESPPKQ
jgi:hypothetical protein